MPDDSINNADDEGGGRIWQGLKALLFKSDHEPSLREQLEEAIDEHEDDDDTRTGANAGDLSRIEREMLRNLLHFSEHTADDVAVPRADIVAIEENARFDELVSLICEHGHSRVPVYRDNLDDIVGMIHIRDAFAILAGEGAKPAGIKELIRQPRFVPESMGVLDLLAEMRATRTHLAIVLDEYSGTEGIVTIEDLVEEIVGDIEDEHDEAPAPQLIELEDGMWEADARIELDDLGKEVAPELEEIPEDVDTLGGLAFVLAGKVPEVGDVLDHPSGWKLEILDGDEKRVTRLRLHPPVDDDDAEN
jgi:magnesium and cobalt transporter